MARTPVDELPQLPRKVECFTGRLTNAKTYTNEFDCYLDEVHAWLLGKDGLSRADADAFARVLRAMPEDVFEIATTAVRLLNPEAQPAMVSQEVGIGMSDKTMTVGELMYAQARTASLG